MKILIVEDEIYSRQSLVKQVRAFCRQTDCVVLQAVNGNEGWEVFQKEAPQVVLSDIKMPILGGIELLRRIREKTPRTQVIMVSGYADFEFARESLNVGAVGYLLKPVDDGELEACLGKIITQSAQQEKEREKLEFLREEDALTPYLYNQILADAPQTDFVRGNVFQKVFDPYLLAGIYFAGAAYPEKDALYLTLRDVFVRTGGTPFRLLVFSQQLWGVLFKEDHQSFAILHRIERCLQEMEYDFFIGTAERHTGAETLRKAYHQVLRVLKSKIFYPHPPRLLLYASEAPQRTGKCLPEGRLLDILRIHLERGDAPGACAVTEKTIEGLFKHPGLSVSSVENCLMLLTTVFHESMAKCAPGQEIQQFRLEFNLLELRGYQEMLDAASQRAAFVCACVGKVGGNRAEGIVDTVLDYINHHYNQELSLRDLAENVFYLNHTYLSHLIREKTGKNYSCYLREVRIRRARAFLKNDGLSITEVATLSGYNDTSQFIQIFKKEVGMTPKKFRDLLQEPEDKAPRP